MNHPLPDEFTALLAQARALLTASDFAAALEVGLRLRELFPDHSSGLHVCGLALLRLGRAGEALPLLRQVTRQQPENGLALAQYAQALLGAGQPQAALPYFDRAEALGIHDARLQRQRYEAVWAAFAQPGDWTHYDRIQRLARQSVVAEGCWVMGEAALASPLFSNAILRRSAASYANHILASLPPLPAMAHATPQGRIRLGFIGADFYEQATAYLMTAFVEAMDRQQFELFAYDYGDARPATPFRQRVEKAYEHFIPIRELDDETAAARIHADRIDVLFSLKNPVSARLGILARRPAPVQVHYLYYPGTSGMPFFDYIVADAIVIPPALESAYSERVLRLPGCYQPNDSGRVRARDSERRRWGLPADAVVLANFSQGYKFTPSQFDLWCLLLKADSRRVLWLLNENDGAREHLERQAALRGVPASQLFFSPLLPLQEHLDRLRHADLVLDTYPYGGHTLSSDALWAGTPVLTLCGETFASRVAASLLHHVGMTDLVASTEQDYLDKAEALLREPGRLQYWRRHLDQGREQFALFNSRHYARQFGEMVQALLADQGSA